jgi:hypothetical protein
MKFLYEACDGFTKEITLEEVKKEVKGYEVGLWHAVSDDGISTIAPLDLEAEQWWRQHCWEINIYE